MVKKIIKSVLALGLLLSVPQLSLSVVTTSVQELDLKSFLPLKDLELMNQDEAMVYMPADFVEVIKNLNSDIQPLKDLIEHVKLGYMVAPQGAVSAAIEHAMKTCSNPVLAIYKQAVLNGDALIRTDITRKSSNKSGRFCRLCVQNNAAVGCLEVANDATICGSLNVAGTITASNFSFGGATCAATSTFPNVSACGNIAFNATGTNQLNAQGSFESRMRLIRGNIALTATGAGITLTPTGAAGTAVTVGTVPTTSVGLGAGFTVGPITGAAFSSGIQATTTLGAATEFYFAVDLQIPVTFATPYSGLPTVLLGLQAPTPFITPLATPLVDLNTAIIGGLGVTNLTASNAVINLVIHVIAQGADYPTAVNNAAIAVNNLIAAGLSVNMVSDGPVV